MSLAFNFIFIILIKDIFKNGIRKNSKLKKKIRTLFFEFAFGIARR